MNKALHSFLFVSLTSCFSFTFSAFSQTAQDSQTTQTQDQNTQTTTKPQPVEVRYYSPQTSQPHPGYQYVETRSVETPMKRTSLYEGAPIKPYSSKRKFKNTETVVVRYQKPQVIYVPVATQQVTTPAPDLNRLYYPYNGAPQYTVTDESVIPVSTKRKFYFKTNRKKLVSKSQRVVTSSNKDYIEYKRSE